LLAQLDGRAGGSGGATVIPTDAMVASSGFGQAIQQGPQPVTISTRQSPNVNNLVQQVQTQTQLVATPQTPGQLAQSQIQVTASQASRRGRWWPA
jgi:hypothetical protein